MVTSGLRELLESDGLEFMMEAHNGLSARIVEETGFKAIWGSGLSISAAHGVRDNNELSWTQVLETAEFMADAVDIPILLDGDTGFGNFNNMRRLVKKLEQRNVAGVCIEDKEFPKTNSFIDSEQQPLADMEEFAGKIAAGKDAQQTDEFCLIARLEAFIAGWGLDEALRRGNRYADAGADAILVHSKISQPDEVLAFAEHWDREEPLVIVPTMYYSTPTEVFEEAGISLAIWANHNLRSAIDAYKETSEQIYEEQTLRNVEDRLPPVKEIFRLQDAQELAEAEEEYLPDRGGSYRAVILAASQGEELDDLTADKPKTMVEINGQPLLHKLVERFNSAGVKDIHCVRGYRSDMVKSEGVKFIESEEHEKTGELSSLMAASDQLEGDCLISYGDILFRKYVLNNLLLENEEFVLVADAAWEEQEKGDYRDFISASRSYSLDYHEEDAYLEEVDPEMASEEIDGEWIGLLKCSARGTEIMKDLLGELAEGEDFHQKRFKDLLNLIVSRGHRVKVIYITGQWVDVDTLDDYSRAHEF